MKNIYFLVIASLMLNTSCKTRLYKPVAANVTNDVTLEELQKGRLIYLKKCSSCHNLVRPRSYTNEQWIHKVDKMQARAKVNNNDKLLILKYLWNDPTPKKLSNK